MYRMVKCYIRFCRQMPIRRCPMRCSEFEFLQDNFFHNTKWLFVKGIEVKMPSLSPTMTEGKISKWLKKEGDSVNPGDVLCEVETDKAVVAFETEEEGILAKILMPEEGSAIEVGTLIALMVEKGEDWKSVEVPKAAGMSASSGKEPADKGSSTPSVVSGSKETHILGGPAVKTLIEKYGITASLLKGTGARGRILKEDVLMYIKEHNINPVPQHQVALPEKRVEATAKPATPRAQTQVEGAKYTDTEVTDKRRALASVLNKKDMPHEYLTITMNMKNIVILRKKWQDEDDSKVSINDCIVKACGVALERYPQLNAVWIDKQCVQAPHVNISIAVATDSGLVTPVVKNISHKRIEDISKEIRELVTKARDESLNQEECSGATFTITNLGMYGIKEFTAVIYYPQCAILAVGSGRIIIDEDGELSTKMRATLCYDRSAVDIEVSAAFLRKLKDLVEVPEQILLGNYESFKDTKHL